MKGLPSAVYVVDPRKEKNAVAEARKLKIPIVSIVDTNCDPDEIDYIIPGNDDAIRAVKLITSKIAEAVLEGRQGLQFALQKEQELAAAEEETGPEITDNTGDNLEGEKAGVAENPKVENPNE